MFLIPFFAKQWSLINSDSSLASKIKTKTDNSLYSVKFSTENILQIINKLDSNKAHGHDEISIRMWKICDSSVRRPLQIIQKSCLDRGKFPQEWKKANSVPVHKKNDKQLVKNYRPVSLLPKCGNIFELILYNFLFSFLNLHFSSQVTVVLINCYQYLMRYITLSMKVMKFDVYFLIYRKHLIKYGTKVLFIN